MKSAGCRVLWFNRMMTVRLWRIGNRTHRKVLLVDGQVGFTGGAVIAKEWQGAGDRPKNWRDNPLPSLRSLTLRGGFFSDRMEGADTAASALGHLRDLEPAGDCLVQFVTAQANYGWGDIARLQDLLIRLAERRIRIQTPYLAPRKVQLDALLDARQRGVEVEFMNAGPHSDRRISKLAGSDEIIRLRGLFRPASGSLVFQVTERPTEAVDRSTSPSVFYLNLLASVFATAVSRRVTIAS